ncbi:MAG: hypothetical protein M3Q30_16635 [Actinomycetota bacterium]|nr:hypothetical protein [Actinomycetota bacterium]
MRRLAVLALVTAVATAADLGLTVAPAWAHICPRPVVINVGQPSTIAVGVTVEATAVPDVEVSVPAGFRLDRVDAKAGSTTTRRGSSLRYRGGPIARFTCEYFSLGVTARTRGAFGIAVVQRAADGKVVARSTPDPSNATDRVLGQIVYAGIKPPSAATGPSGLSATTIASIALVGIGVVMLGALGFRAWRERGLDENDDDGDGDAADREITREAELRARLERFKKRTPDPRPPE